MRPRPWPLLLALFGCAPTPAAPAARPSVTTSTAAPSPSPPPEAEAPPARWRSRRGECDLTKALDEFLLGQQAVRCGDMSRRPPLEEYERGRTCALTAQRERKAFTLVWGGPGIDSIMRLAVAGRAVGDRYEVRWFSYDSCPSGCGDADPMWSSVRCEPLVDMRAACKALDRRKRPASEEGMEMGWRCDEDRADVMRRELELLCSHRTDVQGCGREP